MKDYNLKGVYSSAHDRIDIDVVIKTTSKALTGKYIPFIYSLHCHNVKIFKANKDMLRVYYWDDISYVKRHIDICKVQEIKIISVNDLAYHGSQPDINKNEFEVICDE